MSRIKERRRKKPIGSIIFISAGLVLVVVSALFNWIAVPQLIKLPDDFELTMYFAGVVKLYIDPETKQVLKEDEHVDIPFDLAITASVVPEKSDKDVALVKVEFLFSAPSVEYYGQFSEVYERLKIKDWFFAVERRTGINVAGHNSDADREGYNLTLEIGTKKKDYPVWDIDYGKTVKLQYLREEKLDGNKYKDIPVFVFKEKQSLMRIAAAPIGLPNEISVADALSMLPEGSASAPTIDPNTKIPLEYFKSIDAVAKYEPKAGLNLETVKHHEEFYINTEKYGIKPNPKICELDYSTPRADMLDAVDNTAKNYWVLDLIAMWIPLSLLLTGILLLVTGVILFYLGNKASK